MNSHFHRIKRMHNRSYRKWKQTKNNNDYAKYKRVHNRIVMEVRKAKQETENKTNFDLSQASRSKRWANLCNEIIGSNKGNVEASLIDNGHLVTNRKDKAENEPIDINCDNIYKDLDKNMMFLQYSWTLPKPSD